jgi:glycosyltransferase involved in cell wall biosynthesis
MDVAFCHHLSLSYIGGGEKWLLNLSRELSQRGHNVSIHALPFKLKGLSDPNQIKQLGSIKYEEKFFHKVDADVAYITYHPLSFLNYWTTAPRIAGIHAQVYNANLVKKDYGILPNLAKLANDIVGKYDLKTFNAIHILTPDKLNINRKTYVIPNFVDASFYKPTPKPEEFTVTYASRKVWQKGYDIFNKVKLLLRNKVVFQESNNVPENDMPKFYSDSHVTLAPARVDTFGLSLVESLMCGTPVITSSILAHKRLNAKLFYADTPTSIAMEVMNLKKLWQYNREKYNHLSLRGRQSVLGYDKPIVVDKIENMLREVASAKCARPEVQVNLQSTEKHFVSIPA